MMKESNYFTIPLPIFLRYGENLQPIPNTFDTLSFHILDSEGNIASNSKEMEHLRGSRLAISFDLGDLELPGTKEVLQLKGEMTCLSKWDTPNRSLSNQEELLAAEEIGCSALKHCGIPITTANVRGVITSLLAGVPDLESFHYNHVLPFKQMWILALAFDDFADGGKDTMGSNLTPADIMLAADAICQVLNGNSPLEKYHNTKFPKIEEFCNLFHKFRAELNLISEDRLRPFTESFIEFFQALGWHADHWLFDEDNPLPSEDAYFGMREYDIGCICALETFILACNLNITQSIRNDPLFKFYLKRWSRLTAMMNDVLSLPKEISRGETSLFTGNIILQKAVGEVGGGRKYLEKLITEMMPQLSKEILTMEKKLLKKYEGNDHLRDYFAANRKWYDGGTMWHCTAPRYQTNVKRKVAIILEPPGKDEKVAPS